MDWFVKFALECVIICGKACLGGLLISSIAWFPILTYRLFSGEDNRLR